MAKRAYRGGARHASLTAAAIAIALLGTSAARAEVVTEEDVIRIAREADPEVAAARERVSVAGARGVAAGLYPNPRLSWEREHSPSAEREDELVLSVPLELSGRRSARQRLAEAEVHEARAEAARTRSGAAQAALILFFETLAAGERAAIAERSAERLDEAERVLRRRHEEGAVAGYERYRLELELELAESELREARARAERLREELAIRLGLDRAEPRGDLTTLGDLGVERREGARTALPSRQTLTGARRAARRARDAEDRAARVWVPPISITGGVQRESHEESHYGYVAGVSVALPLFSRGQDLRAETRARARELEQRARAGERRVRREASSAAAAYQLARDELARFEEATEESADRLLRAAESGYREGRRSIVELVDAERARADIERRRIELALAARRAEVSWRAAQGAFE